jgi:hypothetical protein
MQLFMTLCLEGGDEREQPFVPTAPIFYLRRKDFPAPNKWQPWNCGWLFGGGHFKIIRNLLYYRLFIPGKQT